MSDGVIVPISQGRNFGDKSVDELEKMLDSLTPEGDLAPEATPPTPTPEPPVPPEPPPEPPAGDPAPAPPPEPPAEPEPDLVAMEKEGERIARENIEAKLTLQEAHNSRLAGEIGFLREQLKAHPRPTEPYQPESQAELDRLTLLEQNVAQDRAERLKAEVSQAVESEVAALDGTWSKELAAEIATIAPKYAQQYSAALATTDPVLARQIAKGVVLSVKAEAMQVKWNARHETLLAQREASTAANAKAKKAAAPSASGTVPTPPTPTKSFADMTAKEADAWLRANVR